MAEYFHVSFQFMSNVEKQLYALKFNVQ